MAFTKASEVFSSVKRLVSTSLRPADLMKSPNEPLWVVQTGGPRAVLSRRGALLSSLNSEPAVRSRDSAEARVRALSWVLGRSPFASRDGGRRFRELTSVESPSGPDVSEGPRRGLSRCEVALAEWTDGRGPPPL